MASNPLMTAGPLKLAVARLLGSRALGEIIGFGLRHRIPNHGLVFDTSDKVISPEVEAQLLFRMYESAEIRFVKRYARGASTVIDLGSSLGIVASHILDSMTNDGHLICVEANPSLIANLTRTTRRHAKGQHIDIVHGAIAEAKATTVQFEMGPTSAGSHVSTSEGSRGILVSGITLTELLSRFQVTEPFVLVCDIEGSEASLVWDDWAALASCKIIVAELHATIHQGQSRSVRMLSDRIRELGFDVLEQHGPVFVFGQ